MPVVDLSFRLIGKTIPVDHGYALYGAVSRVVPWTHEPEQNALGIHPINGLLAGNRMLHLTPTSRLTFRLDSDDIKELLPLAGKELEVDGHKTRIGVPTVYALKPKAALHSRLVTIKLRDGLRPEPFLAAVQADLTALGIKAQPGLVKRQGSRPMEGRSSAGLCPKLHDPFVRRTLFIKNKTRPAEVVGYAVVVQGLTADESLKLQERGIGGRRRFGCGIFLPVRE